MDTYLRRLLILFTFESRVYYWAPKMFQSQCALEVEFSRFTHILRSFFENFTKGFSRSTTSLSEKRDSLLDISIVDSPKGS